MSWISNAELVSAVSEAGGLGILATGPLQPFETREAIQTIRNQTDRPFGVGVTLMMPGAAENAKVALEEEAPVVNFQLGRGQRLIDGVHRYASTAFTATAGKQSRRSRVSATLARQSRPVPTPSW